ncbi:hypothetical protein QJQ45_007672 [Haematococcus lacustris]|nr:hypothetical protein QJQ45_007672 [Haematococcus lacustris]
MTVYANEYQGGPFVEVLGTQGTNPLSNWRVSGPQKGLQKAYDKVVRSSVFTSSSGMRLQAPKDDKASLGLVQPYLLLQISLMQEGGMGTSSSSHVSSGSSHGNSSGSSSVHSFSSSFGSSRHWSTSSSSGNRTGPRAGQPFTLELGLTDSSGGRRRLILSTSFTEPRTSSLHCQVPFVPAARDTWLNLVTPLAELVTLFSKGAALVSLDSLALSGGCRLRRVLTLRDPPWAAVAPGSATHTGHWAALTLPRGVELPAGVEAVMQVLGSQGQGPSGVLQPEDSFITMQPMPGTLHGLGQANSDAWPPQRSSLGKPGQQALAGQPLALTHPLLPATHPRLRLFPPISDQAAGQQGRAAGAGLPGSTPPEQQQPQQQQPQQPQQQQQQQRSGAGGAGRFNSPTRLPPHDPALQASSSSSSASPLLPAASLPSSPNTRYGRRAAPSPASSTSQLPAIPPSLPHLHHEGPAPACPALAPSMVAADADTAPAPAPGNQPPSPLTPLPPLALGTIQEGGEGDGGTPPLLPPLHWAPPHQHQEGLMQQQQQQQRQQQGGPSCRCSARAMPDTCQLDSTHLQNQQQQHTQQQQHHHHQQQQQQETGKQQQQEEEGKQQQQQQQQEEEGKQQRQGGEAGLVPVTSPSPAAVDAAHGGGVPSAVVGKELTDSNAPAGGPRSDGPGQTAPTQPAAQQSVASASLPGAAAAPQPTVSRIPTSPLRRPPPTSAASNAPATAGTANGNATTKQKLGRSASPGPSPSRLRSPMKQPNLVATPTAPNGSKMPLSSLHRARSGLPGDPVASQVPASATPAQQKAPALSQAQRAAALKAEAQHAKAKSPSRGLARPGPSPTPSPAAPPSHTKPGATHPTPTPAPLPPAAPAAVGLPPLHPHPLPSLASPAAPTRGARLSSFASVQSSVMEVEEEEGVGERGGGPGGSLGHAWDGFGVEEDDMLSSSHLRRQAPGLPPAISQRGGPGGVGAAGGEGRAQGGGEGGPGLASGPEVGAPGQAGGRGLADPLGGPIWSAGLPSPSVRLTRTGPDSHPSLHGLHAHAPGPAPWTTPLNTQGSGALLTAAGGPEQRSPVEGGALEYDWAHIDKVMLANSQAMATAGRLFTPPVHSTARQALRPTPPPGTSPAPPPSAPPPATTDPPEPHLPGAHPGLAGGLAAEAASTRPTQVQGHGPEQLSLVYDPDLRCYYDPHTNTYFELKT